jgi:molecular chaperone IbpA
MGFTFKRHSAKTFVLLYKEKNMTSLHNINTTNLAKALIGIDSMFAEAERIFANSAQSNYPPYNILKTDDDNYIVEVAVTGFEKNEVKINVDNQKLVINATTNRDDDAEYLHRGLATRDFERRFNLTEHMQVGDAVLANGLLRVYIKRVLPEALRPREITIL